MKKRYVVLFSGGKDSLATIIWAKLNIPFEDWDIIFCDTGWEAELTYQYISWIEQVIGKTFIRLKTKVFDDKIDEHTLAAIIEIFGERNVFAEMVINKMRFPSPKSRFCTIKLKVEPCIDYILSLDYDVIVVQGVRAEESEARRNLKPDDEYFYNYFNVRTGKDGKESTDAYRKADVFTWCENNTADVIRPILKWTAEDVFSYIYANGYKPNPLYLMGHSRVGCYPCIMCRLGEIRLIAMNDTKRIKQLELLEELSGSTFFPPEFIPVKYCTKVAYVRVYADELVYKLGSASKRKKPSGMFEDDSTLDPNAVLYDRYFKNDKIKVYLDDDGEEYILKKMPVPSIKDVVKYVLSDPDQQSLIPIGKGCVSVYNICEQE